MQSYEFSMVFALASPEQDPEDYVDRLFEAGCDDALLGIGRAGGIALDFIREAPDARTAVITAISNVRAAIPDSVLVEVSPDLVGFSDVAELVGRSRQNMRKLLLGGHARTPIPVHSGSSTLWHLAPMLVWLRDEKGYDVDPALLDVARAAMAVNAVNAHVRSEPRIVRELEALLTPA
jgi:hypothetical protein